MPKSLSVVETRRRSGCFAAVRKEEARTRNGIEVDDLMPLSDIRWPVRSGFRATSMQKLMTTRGGERPKFATEAKNACAVPLWTKAGGRQRGKETACACVALSHAPTRRARAPSASSGPSARE